MTQEEWLGDYFGTPFEELQSTIRAYIPPAPPQAQPSELPSPPTIEPLSKLATAAQERVRSMLPPITWSDLNQKVELPPETELTNWQNQHQPAVSTMLPHQIPFQSGQENVPRFREFLEAKDQDQWNKGLALGLDTLGAARMLSFESQWRPPWSAKNRPFSTGELRPSVITQAPVPMQQLPPVSGKRYLESFRKAVASDDEAGAINILRNAAREDASIPFRPDDMFRPMSPYVMRELDRYSLQTKGYSPFDIIFRPPDRN